MDMAVNKEITKEKTGILSSYKWDSIKLEYSGIVIGSILNNLLWISSVYDIGCGTGLYVQEFINHGVECIGFELSSHAFYDAKTSLNNIYQIDVSKLMSGYTRRDLVISIETAEHISEPDTDTYLNNLINLSDRWILITSSNKEGRHHLNPQPRKYWIDRLTQSGEFEYNESMSVNLMKIFQNKIKINGLIWFKHSLMVFKKIEAEK
jgi:hypothetical protein